MGQPDTEWEILFHIDLDHIEAYSSAAGPESVHVISDYRYYHRNNHDFGVSGWDQFDLWRTNCFDCEDVHKIELLLTTTASVCIRNHQIDFHLKQDETVDDADCLRKKVPANLDYNSADRVRTIAQNHSD